MPRSREILRLTDRLVSVNDRIELEITACFYRRRTVKDRSVKMPTARRARDVPAGILSPPPAGRRRMQAESMNAPAVVWEQVRERCAAPGRVPNNSGPCSAAGARCELLIPRSAEWTGAVVMAFGPLRL